MDGSTISSQELSTDGNDSSDETGDDSGDNAAVNNVVGGGGGADSESYDSAMPGPESEETVTLSPSETLDLRAYRGERGSGTSEITTASGQDYSD